MTIVAASAEKNRILIVADCRVSFDDGQRHDALQKVYFLGPRALVAFAGSVGLASSALREMVGKKGIRLHGRLDAFTRRLARIANRKAHHRRKTKGPTGTKCSFIIAGYVGRTPYLATIAIDGHGAPKLRIEYSVGSHTVIGSGEAERATCHHTIARGSLQKFSDDQAVFAFGSFIDAGLSLIAAPERFDEGIGKLKLHFVIRTGGWKFVPMHLEQFRGRIADRNRPLGYAPLYSVGLTDDRLRFVLREHQSNSVFPLANVLEAKHGVVAYDLRGIIKEDFDPYFLQA